MILVFPGVEEVFANPSLLQSILIREDLPTLLLPINAYSGFSGLGHVSTDGLEIIYTACFIVIRQSNRKAVQDLVFNTHVVIYQ